MALRQERQHSKTLSSARRSEVDHQIDCDSGFGCLKALQLYMVGSTERPPKLAPHIGKLGQMDIDSLLESAKLVSLDEGVRLINGLASGIFSALSSNEIDQRPCLRKVLNVKVK